MMPAVPKRQGGWRGAWCALAAFIAMLVPASAEGAAKLRGQLALGAWRPHVRRHHRGRSARRHPRRARRSRRTSRARGCPNADLVPDAANLVTVEHATLCIVNHERREHRLVPLSDNAALRRAAARYSRAMVRRDFFGDVPPSRLTVTQRVARSGYVGTGRRAHPARAVRLAENLAYGCGPLATPASIVRAWMASPAHRAILLGPRYRATGIGIVAGAPSRVRGGWKGPAATYTQYFASQR
jgi:uncharacterized protein YkwD